MRSALIAVLFASPLSAGVDLTFIEGAPKDRFVLTNAGCALTGAQLTIDLSTAPAGVIFDVTADGAGVEVFQPVVVEAGNVSTSTVSDGDQVLDVMLGDLGPDARIVISADLDDLQTQSDLGQIRVSGAEIAMTTAVLVSQGQEYRAGFADNAVAQFDITGLDCAPSSS